MTVLLPWERMWIRMRISGLKSMRSMPASGMRLTSMIPL